MQFFSADHPLDTDLRELPRGATPKRAWQAALEARQKS
jgi:hypothetical protein